MYQDYQQQDAFRIKRKLKTNIKINLGVIKKMKSKS